jgi:hypothetical protein
MEKIDLFSRVYFSCELLVTQLRAAKSNKDRLGASGGPLNLDISRRSPSVSQETLGEGGLAGGAISGDRQRHGLVPCQNST